MRSDEATATADVKGALRRDSLTAAIAANSIRQLGAKSRFLKEASLGISVCEALEMLGATQPEDRLYEQLQVLRNAVSNASPQENRWKEAREDGPGVLALLRKLQGGERLDDPSLMRCERFFRRLALALEG